MAKKRRWIEEQENRKLKRISDRLTHAMSRACKGFFNIKIKNLKLSNIIFKLFDFNIKAISQYEYSLTKLSDYNGYNWSIVINGATYSGTFSGVTTIDGVASTLSALGFGDFSVDTDFTSVNYLYVSSNTNVFGVLSIGSSATFYRYELAVITDYNGYSWSIVINGTTYTGTISTATAITSFSAVFSALGFDTFIGTKLGTNNYLGVLSPDNVYGDLEITRPAINGWTYNSISVNNPSTMFWLTSSIGWVGTGVAPYSILKTTNGGTSWTTQVNTIATSIKKIYFIDANNGWALPNSSSIIYYTTNGGTTWTAGNTVTPRVISDFMFLDSLVGIASWKTGLSGGALVTTDGGINWTDSSTGLVNLNYESVSKIYQVLTDQISYICGGGYLFNNGSIYKTIDGGANWTTLTPPSANRSYIKIYFPFDESTGYLFGYKLSPDTTYIYKTTDGGANWTEILNIGDAGFLGDIFFIDSNTGWVAGQFGIYKTTDGGANWTQQSNDTLLGTTNKFISNIAMRTSIIGYAITGSDAGYNANPLTTTTSGADIPAYNEDETPTLVVNDWLWNGLVNPTNGQSILNARDTYFFDENNGLCCGADISAFTGVCVYYTNNKGVTWNPCNSITYNGGANYESEIDRLSQVPNSTLVCYGVSAGNGRLYKTIDGGLNWTFCINLNTVSAGDNISIKQLAFISDNIGFIILTGGIFKTIDGGLNWTSIYSNANIVFGGGISFCDSNNGLAFTQNGTTQYCYKTTDGGSNWTEIIVPTFSGMVSYVSPNIAYFSFSTGIYKTIDGGLNWNLQLTGFYYSIRFSDENNGIITGSGGTKITTDGGSNWVLQQSLGVPVSDGAGRSACITTNISYYVARSSSPLVAKIVWDSFIYTPRLLQSLNGERMEIQYTSVPYNGFLNSLLGQPMIINSIDIQTNKVAQLQNQFIYNNSDVLGDTIKRTDFTQINPYQPNGIILTDIRPTMKDFILSGNDTFEGELIRSTETDFTELRLNFKTEANCKDNNLPKDDLIEDGEIIVDKPSGDIIIPKVINDDIEVKPKKIIKILSPFGVILLKR